MGEARRAGRRGRKLTTRFTIRRSRTWGSSSGHCWGDNRIVITIGKTDDEASIKSLLLHELAHAASKCRQNHGDGFRSVFLDAAREAYGVESIEVHAQVERVDTEIAKAIREEAQ